MYRVVKLKLGGSAAWRSVQFIVPYDTKLEGEAEHENLLSVKKGLQERRVSLSFDVYKINITF